MIGNGIGSGQIGLSKNICPVCDKEFTPYVFNQKFCCEGCRSQSQLVWVREKIRRMDAIEQEKKSSKNS